MLQLQLGRTACDNYRSSLGGSFSLAHQNVLLVRAERDVRFGLAAQFVRCDLEPNSDVERRLIKAQLRGEGVVGRPGSAGRDRLFGQTAPCRASLLPRITTTGNLAKPAVDFHSQCGRPVL